MATLSRLFWRDDGAPRRSAWLALAAMIRVSLVAMMLRETYARIPERMIRPFAETCIDAGYFFTPVEHLLSDGTMWYREGVPFAGRMPGYPGPYYILRQFLGVDATLNVLVVCQVLLGIVATYAIAKTSQLLFQSRVAFAVAFFLAAFNLFGIAFEYQTLAESFTYSAFAIHSMYFVKYLRAPERRTAVLAGAWLAWAIFLRPSSAAALPIEVLIVLWRSRRTGVRTALVAATLLCAPFVAADSVWIARNWRALGKFVPLHTEVHESYGRIYSEPWLAVRHWIAAWGGDRAYARPGGVAQWIRRARLPRDFAIPPEAIGDAGYTAEDIRDLRDQYQRFMSLDLDAPERDALGQRVVDRAREMRESYVDAHPFRAYVIGPAKMARRLVLHSGSTYLAFSDGSSLRVPVRLLAGLWYYGVLGAAILASIRCWRDPSRRQFVVASWVYVGILVPGVIASAGTEQARYIHTAHAAWIALAPGALLLLPRFRPGPTPPPTDPQS